MNRRMSRGFGLIELLLVIAIIGILAGLILSAASRGRQKAFDAGIENAVRQIRWQAEIAFNSNNNSYQNWTSLPLIQEELTILLDEIDKHYGDNTEGSYVTVMRDSQINEFCVSAPSRATVGQYFCVDGTGELKMTTEHCPDYPAGGPELQCP